ncbi:MAG: glycoside hydrolase family 43 protein [Bacteroidales bacterium]
MIKIAFLISLYSIFGGSIFCQQAENKIGVFTNPVLSSGADPWIIQKNGIYYYVNSSGRGLILRKSGNIADLKTSQQKIVWSPPEGTSYSKELWAPELHLIQGKWYIYFAADDGNNKNHRLYVIENTSRDPMDRTWKFKGKVSDPSDKWAIDGSAFKFHGKLYFIWSGWEGDVNGEQNIYIAKMKNPWSIESERVRISTPVYEWEKTGDLNNPNDVPHVNVNEGPVILKNKRKLFLIYSASGCWTDSYCLGMLTFMGKDNLLDPMVWRKNPVPVFKQKPESGVYAPGHNSFFKSPDGKENWILYHANSDSGQGCGKYRSPRTQKFTFKKDGSPDFGEPVKSGIPLAVPSETKK